MTEDNQPIYEYQIGGALPGDSPTYVKRKADSQLYEAIRDGEFCYVLNARQMGKSSLQAQVKRRLEVEGFCCAIVDLTEIGSLGITPEQWYADLIDTLVSRFNLFKEFDFNDWWGKYDEKLYHVRISPMRILSKFIEEVLLERVSKKIVIFIDEIDSLLSLGVPMDDFFAFVRACYNKRSYSSKFKRITFVLLGVATPTDLIRDKRRTPFNIGNPIDLRGFQLDEIEPLAKGLQRCVSKPLVALEEILKWTNGQPILTQMLCQLVLNYHQDALGDREADIVSHLVNTKILERWKEQDQQEHFKTIQTRILNNKKLGIRNLKLYKQLLLQHGHWSANRISV